MNADDHNLLPIRRDRKIIDPPEVLADWRVAGRGSVAKVLGWVAWQPVPTRWMQECAALGRWPARLAGLLLQLNGRRWTWRWLGSPSSLWRDVLRVKWPGAIGRDTMLRAWRALLARDLIVWRDPDGWRCNTDGLAENANDCAQIPESRAAKVWRYKVTRVCASGREGVSLHETVGSTVEPPSDPDPRPSPDRSQIDPARTDAPAGTRALHAEGQLRGTGMRLPGGSAQGEGARIEKISAQALQHAAPVSTAEVFSKRIAGLRRDLMKRWGPTGIYRFELQSALLYDLQQASLSATDEEWGEAVTSMLKRDDPPSAVAKYLTKLVQVYVGKRRNEPRSLVERDALAERVLADTIKKCNAPTANDAEAAATQRTQGPAQGLHPPEQRANDGAGGARPGGGRDHAEGVRQDPRAGRGRGEDARAPRDATPRDRRDGDRPRLDDRDAPARAESQLGQPREGSARVEAVPRGRGRQRPAPGEVLLPGVHGARPGSHDADHDRGVTHDGRSDPDDRRHDHDDPQRGRPRTRTVPGRGGGRDPKQQR